jgi:hypothetical protein
MQVRVATWMGLVILSMHGCDGDSSSPATSATSATSTTTSTTGATSTSGAGGMGGSGASSGGASNGGAGGGLSDIGGPCAMDGDCEVGVCITEYPGGYCTIRNCDPVTNPCPQGTSCQGGGMIGSTACFVDCTSPADCRPDYDCCGPMVCGAPGFGFCF